MQKLKLVSAVLGAAMLLSATPAFAATISNPLFSNSDVTIDATGNATVSGTYTLQVGQNEVCEVTRTQVDPSQPFTENSVSGPLGYQQGTYTNLPFTVKVPPNTSTVYPTIQCAGIWGGNRSIDGNDNVIAGPAPLGTIRITANSSTSGSTSGSGVFGFASFADFLVAIKAGLGVTSATVTVSPLCTEFATFSDLSKGDYGAEDLQNFLIDNGEASRITAGATGYFGSQTQKAVNHFRSAKHCA